MAEQSVLRRDVSSSTSGRAATNDQALSTLKKKHDEAFKLINQAITFEVSERYDQAKYLYSKGISKLDEALNVPTHHCKDASLKKVKDMQQKMRRTRQEASSRLSAISAEDFRNIPPDNPILPSYSEACGESTNNHIPPSSNRIYPELNSGKSRVNARNMTNSEVNEVLDNFLNESITEEASAPQEHEVVDVLMTMNDVQMYFISTSGFVSAPTYPAPLRILSADKNNDNLGTGPALLQVGSWTYPLLPGKSPILQKDTGCYLFPDVTSEEPGAAVGLMLPSTTSQSEIKQFESLMKDLTAMHTSEFAPSAPLQELDENVEGSKSKPTSEKISQGLAKGGELISFGLTKGAETATKLFKYGGSKIKSRLVPEEKPTKIDPRVQKGLKIAKDTTSVAVVATGFIVSKVGEATVALARAVAPHIERYGSEMLAKASNSNDQKKRDAAVNNVVEVASGSLKGLAAVYLGLEAAAKILAKSLTEETVQIIDQKYGRDAACVTGDSIHSAINLALTARNVTALGPKGLAKQVAKDTGKVLIQNCKDSKPM